jgi:hypothetical protein
MTEDHHLVCRYRARTTLLDPPFPSSFPVGPGAWRKVLQVKTCDAATLRLSRLKMACKSKGQIPRDGSFYTTGDVG